jgi:activating signal cointegrator 1
MKVLTLWEPWATLMAMGAKKIETRHWSDNYRGPVAIHSAKGGLSQAELFEQCCVPWFLNVLKDDAKILKAAMSPRQVRDAFPCGHIIAVGTLVDCLPVESLVCLPGVFEDYPKLDTQQERAFGNYESGRWGFVFENVKRLPAPIPFKSRQGKLLEVDPKTLECVRLALEKTA